MIEWKNVTGKYSSGEDGFLGKWCVATVGWDGVNRTNDKWIVFLHLPGLKSRLKQQYKEIEDAKKRAQQAVDNWIKESTLVEKF
jgi:hypothetical protein